MASDGITKLIKVTQQKSTNANEEALEGAANQRSNIDKQKSLRDVQKTLDSFTQDSSMSRADTKATAKPGANLNSGAIASEASVSKPASYLTRFSKSGFENVQSVFSSRVSKKSSRCSLQPHTLRQRTQCLCESTQGKV